MRNFRILKNAGKYVIIRFRILFISHIYVYLCSKKAYMELTKQDRRVLKDIIRIGILRRCEEWLTETSTLINKEYVDDENAFERCMEVTKRSRDFFKEAMRREDYYRNTMIELGIENLLFEGYLTETDFVKCREELRSYILERHQQLKNMRLEKQ